jgi:opacity protein-like surface antigen
MSSRIRFLALVALTCFAPSAFAQQSWYSLQDAQPVRFYLMGGFTQPVGNTNDILQGGWTVGFGVAFRKPESPLALRLELNYASNNATNSLINQGQQSTGLRISGGYADLFWGTANVEYQVPFKPGINGYVVGGVGGYYTQISLTERGFGFVCNPWWGFCFIASGNVIVAQHDVTKFGFNAGVGVSFRLRGGTVLFVESRYNAVQMPQTFEFVPINVGVRF